MVLREAVVAIRDLRPNPLSGFLSRIAATIPLVVTISPILEDSQSMIVVQKSSKDGLAMTKKIEKRDEAVSFIPFESLNHSSG